MQKSGGFHRPLHFFLPLRLEEGAQGVEKLEPAVLLLAASQLTDQRQQPLDHGWVNLPQQSR